MNRKQIGWKSVSCLVPPDLLDDINEIAKASLVRRPDVLRFALKQYIDRYRQTHPKQPDASRKRGQA